MHLQQYGERFLATFEKMACVESGHSERDKCILKITISSVCCTFVYPCKHCRSTVNNMFLKVMCMAYVICDSLTNL